MLYMKVEGDENNKLRLYCKNCSFSRIEDSATACVATKNFSSDANSYKSFMTPHIKYDPALPRVNNIKCPECQPEKNEVIYLKYDHDNMKYLYFCCNCEHFWRS